MEEICQPLVNKIQLLYCYVGNKTVSNQSTDNGERRTVRRLRRETSVPQRGKAGMHHDLSNHETRVESPRPAMCRRRRIINPSEPIKTMESRAQNLSQSCKGNNSGRTPANGGAGKPKRKANQHGSSACTGKVVPS